MWTEKVAYIRLYPTPSRRGYDVWFYPKMSIPYHYTMIPAGEVDEQVEKLKLDYPDVKVYIEKEPAWRCPND